MNYVKSLLMNNFLFGIKHKDIIYISEQIFDIMKDIENSRIDISKLAIFDYDNIIEMRNELKFDDDEFKKVVRYAEFVIFKGST